jgi:hypothetical protein
MGKLTISMASVKVMRSYDYCHFEVNLTASVNCPPDSGEWYQQVDSLRKNAARLADKAVAQYKTAKVAHQAAETKWDSMRWAAEQAGKTPESERTPEEKAAIKALEDARFAQRHYDYQDDWDQDE